MLRYFFIGILLGALVVVIAGCQGSISYTVRPQFKADGTRTTSETQVHPPTTQEDEPVGHPTREVESQNDNPWRGWDARLGKSTRDWFN